jgi:hypothetical protein
MALRSILSASCFFALTHCAAFEPDKQLKVSVPPVRETPTVESGRLSVWANTEMFWGAPSDVEGWVAAVGLDIENRGDVSIEFQLDDFRMIDDRGRKAAPFFVPVIVSFPVDVETLRAGARQSPPPTTSTSVFVKDTRRVGPSGAQGWRDQVGNSNVPPHAWEEKVRFIGAPRPLQLSALADRTIEPQSRLTGYLYFPRPFNDASKAWLVWKVQGGPEEVRIPFDLLPKVKLAD